MSKPEAGGQRKPIGLVALDLLKLNMHFEIYREASTEELSLLPGPECRGRDGMEAPRELCGSDLLLGDTAGAPTAELTCGALDHTGEAGALDVSATYVSDILLNCGVFFKKLSFPGKPS